MPYLAHAFVARAFSIDGDRVGLLSLIEHAVDGDPLGMNARRSTAGVRIAFQAVAMSACVP